jgi:hypothetical protein
MEKGNKENGDEKKNEILSSWNWTGNNPSSAEDKNAWSSTFTPLMRFHGVAFIAVQGQLLFLVRGQSTPVGGTQNDELEEAGKIDW